MNRSTSSEGGGGAASRLSVIPDWFCLSGSQRSTSYGTGDNNNNNNNNNTIMDMMLDDSFSALSKKQDTTSTSFDRCQFLGGGGGGNTTATNTRVTSDIHDDATQLQIQEEMANLSVQEQESARNSVLGKSSMTMTSSSSKTENKNKIANTGYGGEETVSTTTTPTTTTIHHQNKEEDPELLQERLYELDQELDTLDIAAAINMPTTKSAYRLAIEQNPIYINDKKFKTAFLRSERYNAKNSALRIFRFLEEKLDLFGTNKLCQDILLDDIGDDGLRILQIGGHHILPKRDKANRKVVFGISAVEQIGYTIFGARKAHFYFWMSLVESDNGSNQIRGIVGILWLVHHPPLYSAVADAANKTRECVPIKISAYHVCHGILGGTNGNGNGNGGSGLGSGSGSDSKAKYLNLFAKIFFPNLRQFGRLRYYRAHYGTSIECQYSLMTQYGCPSDYFPLIESQQQQQQQPYNGSDNKTGSTNASALFHIQYVQDWMVERIQIDAEKKRSIITMGETPTIVGSPSPSTGNNNTNNNNNNNQRRPSRRMSSFSVNSMRMSMGISVGGDVWGDQSLSNAFQLVTDEDNIYSSRSSLYRDSLLCDLLQESVATIEGGEGDAPSRENNNRLGSINDLMFNSMMTLDEADDEEVTENGDIIGNEFLDAMTEDTINPTTNGTSATTSTTNGYTSNCGGLASSAAVMQPKPVVVIEDAVVAGDNDNDGDMDMDNNDDDDGLIPLRDTSQQDVLLGRGRPLQKHEGNLRLRQLISDRIEEYERSNKHKKTEIAEKIVQNIYEGGGRFLKQATPLDKGTTTATKNNSTTENYTTYSLWEEIDDHTARLKVSYTFRTFRKMNKAK